MTAGEHEAQAPGGADPAVFAEAVRTLLAIRRGEVPDSVPRDVLIAVSAIAWTEAAGRRQAAYGLPLDAARAAAVMDFETALLNLDNPDLAGVAEVIVAEEAA